MSPDILATESHEVGQSKPKSVVEPVAYKGSGKERSGLTQVVVDEIKPGRPPLTPEKRKEYAEQMKQHCLEKRCWQADSPLTAILSEAMVDSLFFEDMTTQEAQAVINGLAKSTFSKIHAAIRRANLSYRPDAKSLIDSSASFTLNDVAEGLKTVMSQIPLAEAEKVPFIIGYAADQLMEYNGNIYQLFAPRAQTRLRGVKGYCEQLRDINTTQWYGNFLRRTAVFLETNQTRNLQSTFAQIIPNLEK